MAAMRFLLTLCLATFHLSAQTKTTWNDVPAYTLANGLIEVTVLTTGGTIAGITLASDQQKTNPLWDPVRFARETGNAFRGSKSDVGHFLCLDGFGSPSSQERAAGLSFHGEARRQSFVTKAAASENGRQVLTLEADLPLAQERLTRTLEIREGENVLYVRSELQSHTAFDRPMSWAEHATIGSPFLEAGVTVVDAPVVKAQTRPYVEPQARRLAAARDFDWPMAPLREGGTVDIRSAPVKLGSVDHTAQLVDQGRNYTWVTAINPNKRLIVGWIWRPADFPWLQNWESYPTSGKLARGLEFSTQPFDIPRRETVDMRQMFGTPTYQWLPAKSTITKTFAFFYATTPEGMTKVANITVQKGLILVEDGSGRRIDLRATGSF